MLDLRDDRLQTDRYGYIEDLRRQSWYARTTDGGVAFFNQEDVVEIFRCEDFRFTFNQIDAEKSPYLAKAIQNELLNMHGAQHKRLSRLVKQALRDRIIEGMAANIDRIAGDLARDLPASGEVEFCTAFADPLPARVLGPMFGLPYEEVEGLNDWMRIGGRKLDALQSGVGIKEVEDANRKIHGFLRDLLAKRRDAPGEDLFSELIRAELDGDRMSEDELVYLSSELASAGVDTTRTQLPLIVNALLSHPAEMAKLRDNPGLALRAVDEGMRFAPLPWAIPHSAIRDFTYKDVAFAKGDIAYAVVPAANRDPSVIDRPNEFDISRARTRNFAFGHGMHACPGAQLARMEMSAALRALVTQTSEVARAGDPEWEPGQVGRGLKRLPLTIGKNA